MSPAGADLKRLSAALAKLERSSRDLAWAEERPWRRKSHLWLEGDLVVVDLHDLDVKHAKRLVDQVPFDKLQSGAICFITGRGRHSVSGKSAIRNAISGILGGIARRRGWRLSPAGPGRLHLVLDEARAPAAASGQLGPLFWIGVLGFFGPAAWLCLGAPGT